MNRMKEVLGKMCVVSVVMTIAGGCATHPDNIASSYVSDLQYQNYNCQQLALESGRVNKRISSLYNQARKTANRDAVQAGIGVVLFLPVLLLLEGGDGQVAAEYARLKGEFEAIEKTAIKKKCGLKLKQWKPAKPATDKIPADLEPDAS